MKLGIIIGSHRTPSNSAKVAQYIASEVLKSMPDVKIWSHDLGRHPLPLWDDSIWAGAASWKEKWDPISAELRECDGFIVLAPEYGGMVSPALKNFFLLCSSKELGHKPGLIVAVSSGRGGSYPVAELRSSSYKNTRINWIPDHVIVRDADNVLNSTTPSDDADVFIRSSINYSVGVLTAYANALKAVRDSGVIDYKTHPYGM